MQTQIANRRAIARNGEGRVMEGTRLGSEAGNSDVSMRKRSAVYFTALGRCEYATYADPVVIW